MLLGLIVVNRWDQALLSQPAPRTAQKLRHLKELGFSICLVLSLGSEETTGPWEIKMPVSASLAALIRDESLPSLPFRALHFQLDLMGPDPKETIPLGTTIRDFIMHHISQITPCFLGKKPFSYY